MPIIVAILGVVIVVMGAVLFFGPDKSEENNEAPESQEMTESASPAPNDIPTELSKDPETMNRTEEMEREDEPTVQNNPEDDANVLAQATLSEDVSYLTPARTEHKMKVSLTIEASSNEVKDASITYDEGEGYSNPNQERFDAAYKAEVIGKPLSEISLSRVGGASLTSQAFNDAVAGILKQLDNL